MCLIFFYDFDFFVCFFLIFYIFESWNNSVVINTFLTELLKNAFILTQKGEICSGNEAMWNGRKMEFPIYSHWDSILVEFFFFVRISLSFAWILNLFSYLSPAQSLISTVNFEPETDSPFVDEVFNLFIFIGFKSTLIWMRQLYRSSRFVTCEFRTHTDFLR